MGAELLGVREGKARHARNHGFARETLPGAPNGRQIRNLVPYALPARSVPSSRRPACRHYCRGAGSSSPARTRPRMHITADACCGLSTYSFYRSRRRCECPLGRHGLDCSIPIPDPEPQCKEHSHNLVTCTSFTKTLCLNSCNGQGWCAGGFCHCKPGAWLSGIAGHLCAWELGGAMTGLSKVFAHARHRTRVVQPRL